MKKLSVSIDDDHEQRLTELQDTEDLDSRSAAVRYIFDEYERLRSECEDLRTEAETLRTRLESREARIDELEAQLAKRSQIESKVDTLAKRVEETDQPDPPFVVRWWKWWRSRGRSKGTADP